VYLPCIIIILAFRCINNMVAKVVIKFLFGFQDCKNQESGRYAVKQKGRRQKAAWNTLSAFCFLLFAILNLSKTMSEL
jgi:hypothetical protein